MSSSPNPPSNAQAATSDKPNTAGKKRGLFWGLGTALLLGFLVWALWYVVDGRWQVGTEDAYVQGDLAPISSQVAATVVQVYAREKAIEGLKQATGSILLLTPIIWMTKQSFTPKTGVGDA